jgi:hypothetical protein
VDAGGCNHLSQIMGGGLTLDIDTESQDHFGGTLISDTLKQLTNPELLRPDAIQR